MAEIDKKFILAKQKSTFENRLESGDVKDTSIAFIEDSEQIWTQGNYYTCVPSDGTNGQVLKKTSNGPEWQNETTYTEVSSVKSGLMSATDKIKLDGIDINANKYVLPAATSDTLGGVKGGPDIVVGGDGSVTVNNKVIPKMYRMGVNSKYKLFSILNGEDKASTTFSILSPVLSNGLGYAKYIAYRPYEGTAVKNWSIRCIYATDSSMYNRIKLVRTGDATFDVYYESNTGNDYCTFILDETTQADLEIVAAGVSSIPEDIYKESEYASIYLGDIHGSLKGNADTATKATQDGNGNNIVSTYATKDIATTSKSGLMSNTDKSKLDGIAANANNYSLPAASSTTLGGIKVGSGLSISGGVLSVTGGGEADSVQWENVLNKPGNATTSTDGFMSSSDKSKLNGIESGAQVNDVTSVAGKTGAVTLSKSDVGLGNVTNESKATMFTNAALTGTPTAPTAGTSTNSTQIATTAFVQSVVNDKIAASDAMIYKGTVGSGGTISTLPTTYKTGWTYKVASTGVYAGKVCEVGDMLIALVDRSGSGTSNSDWTVVQTNIDGAVTGPTTSVDSRVAVFNGSTGKIIKDSGFTIGASVPSNAKFTDTTYNLVTTSTNGLMSAADKVNLDRINSVATSGILSEIPSINYSSDSAEIEYTLKQNSGDGLDSSLVSISIKQANDSDAGLMSSEDKIKLDNIQEGYIAFVNSSDAINIDNYPQSDYGTIAIWFNQAEADGTPPGQEGIVFQTKYKSEQGDSGSGYIDCISQLYFGPDGVKQRSTVDYDAANPFDGIVWTSTTYSIATTSANGLMSSLDKKKLDVLNQNNIMSSSVDGYPAILLGGDSTINNSNQSTYISAGTLSSSGNGSYIRTGTSKRIPLELKTYGQKNYINIETENYTNPGFNQTSAPITLTCGAGGQILLNTSDTSKQGIVDIHGSLVIEDGNSNRVLLQAKSSQTLQVGTNLTVAGTITGSHMYKSSDARLKENVIPVSADKYQLADQLQIKEFDFIETKKHSVGLIAQDVEQVLPDIVNTNEEGYKSIDYIEYLLLKVQALEERIKQLENK